MARELKDMRTVAAVRVLATSQSRYGYYEKYEEHTAQLEAPGRRAVLCLPSQECEMAVAVMLTMNDEDSGDGTM
jgi:hypothetical protein